MEWLVGIYFVIDVFKTLNRFGNPNPALKPVWMSLERNPINIVMYFTFHVLVWPLPGK